MASGGGFEDIPHPFTSYNKQAQSQTLIGNWNEERGLQDVTGVTRYETWVDKSKEEPVSVYTKRQDQTKDMATHPRVMEHTDQLHPQDYKTIYQATFGAKNSSNPLAQNVYKDVTGLGPRERLAQQQLLEEARVLPDAIEYTLTGVPVDPVLASTYRDGYQEHDLRGVHVGAKVMRDHDGRPAVRDPTFLAETNLIPKQRADRVMPGAQMAGATMTGRLPDPSVPVTIYSEAVANGQYGGAVYGTRTLSGPTRPFNKDAGFSKPMSEYSKIVESE